MSLRVRNESPVWNLDKRHSYNTLYEPNSSTTNEVNEDRKIYAMRRDTKTRPNWILLGVDFKASISMVNKY